MTFGPMIPPEARSGPETTFDAVPTPDVPPASEAAQGHDEDDYARRHAERVARLRRREGTVGERERVSSVMDTTLALDLLEPVLGREYESMHALGCAIEANGPEGKRIPSPRATRAIAYAVGHPAFTVLEKGVPRTKRYRVVVDVDDDAADLAKQVDELRDRVSVLLNWRTSDRVDLSAFLTSVATRVDGWEHAFGKVDLDDVRALHGDQRDELAKSLVVLERALSRFVDPIRHALDD